jgi:hypothetical protein
LATWVTHIRLAEALIARGLTLDVDSFLAGSVAPDSSRPNASLTALEPPKRLTHWYDSQGDIDAEAYYRRYLAKAPLDDCAWAFHMGYYVHLLADREWEVRVWRPKKETPLYQKALANIRTAMHEVKYDWYGLDFLYLQAHPESLFYERFRYIDAVPDYLDYLAPGLLTETIHKIQAFYRTPKFDLNRPYVYLSQPEIDAYVELTTEKLAQACAHLL